MCPCGGLSNFFTVLLFFVAMLTCAERSPARAEELDCDPLVPEQCLMPFPNSYFLRPDNSTETGFSVNFDKNNFPADTLGSHPFPSDFNSLDGFSPFPSILSYFPLLSSENLPKHWNMETSLHPESPTVLLEAQNGKRVAHFAELDAASLLSFEHALMVWPAHRLNDNTRYIVALRGLQDVFGDPIKPSPTFLAFRDKIPTSNKTIENRRAHFEEIFTLLEKADIKRDSLQLAWDFHTASLNSLTKRLLFMRDDSFRRITNICPSYNVTSVQDDYSEHIFRHIEGEFRVPYYSTSPEPGSSLVIGSNGLPVFQGVTTAKFEVLIPRSLVPNATYTPQLPGRIVQYGHGLFGDRTEVRQSYLQEQANRYGYMLAACDWWGMSKSDLPALIALLATNLSRFNALPDRLSQGVMNALLLMRLMKGSFSHDKNVMFAGRSVYNPEFSHFYGNSLGGIIGSVYMAVTGDVQRGTIGVGGGPFGLLMPRSKDFFGFEVGLRLLYPRSLDFIAAIALMNMILTRCGPGGYMSSIYGNSLPGALKHEIIIQYGLGDAQVNILAVQSLARTASAVIFKSNVRETFELQNRSVATEKFFGFDMADDIAVVKERVVLQGADFGAGPEPYNNSPPSSKTDSHEQPRRYLPFHQQMDLFFRTGEVRNFCGSPPGPCQEKTAI